MLLEAVDLPYYGNFLMLIAGFHERPDIKTCAVNVTSAGMQFYYNKKFLDSLPQKMVNFIIIHEIFHLFWGHPKRTISGNYDPKLANIAQDMIINHVVYSDIIKDFIEIPQYPDGKNMALFIPEEYDGPLIFEYLYVWLRDNQQKFLNKKLKAAMSGGDEQSDEKIEEDEKPSYGKFGKLPSKNPTDEKIENFSLDEIFENIENSNGEYLDSHIGDTISEEMRDGIINDNIEKAKSRSRGFGNANITETMDKLRKKRKDHLSYIKKAISSQIIGGCKIRTITRPNRRGIEGLKGKKKIKFKITILLDVSGSMSGLFERILSYVYKNDIEIDLIEADVEVKFVKNIKNTKGLQRIKIKGLGGTVLQPGVDLIVEKYNKNNLLILTDGICDKLDLSRVKGNILVISMDKEVPITKSNGKIKQIIVSKTE
jgi:predicted metal-dependent peptidase